MEEPGFVPHDGFDPNHWSGHLIFGTKPDPAKIAVHANACTVLDLAMWPTGSIQGTLRDSNGTPLAGFPVQVFVLDSRNQREGSPFRVSITAKDGTFKLQPLPSGSYVVGVNAGRYKDDNVHPPALYNDGETVFLEERGTLTGIDLRPSSPRTPARIRVTVLGRMAAPTAGRTSRWKPPMVDTHGVPVEERTPTAR
jgi:hypothetical protein